MAEILNCPLGTIHVAASGRRSLPAQKIELLEKLVEAAKSPGPEVSPSKLVIPNDVAQTLRKEFKRRALIHDVRIDRMHGHRILQPK